MGEAKNIYFICLKLLFLGPIFRKTLSHFIQRLDSFKMQNEAGEYVDLYIPRKCSASNRIIGAGSCIRADQYRYGGRKNGPNDGREQDVRHLRQDSWHGRE